jgi:hypothetical protein
MYRSRWLQFRQFLLTINSLKTCKKNIPTGWVLRIYIDCNDEDN